MPLSASQIKRRIDALGDAEIGRRIKAARLLRGYKQRELNAHEALRADGLTTRVVGNIERGTRSATPKDLTAIARVLGAPLAYFVSDDPLGPVAMNGDGEGQVLRVLQGRLEEILRSLDDLNARLDLLKDQRDGGGGLSDEQFDELLQAMRDRLAQPPARQEPPTAEQRAADAAAEAARRAAEEAKQPRPPETEQPHESDTDEAASGE